MDIERELGRYIRGELVRERPGDKPVVKFHLRHAAAGAKGADVDSWDISEERIQLDDIPRLAAEICARAQTDADGLGVAGPQRYVVQAYTRGDTRGGTRFAFSLRANNEDDIDGGGEDAPTMRGALTQQMRHNEALARILAQVVGTTNSQMSRQLEAQAKELETMRAERAQNFLALEAAKSEEHYREMDAMKMLNGEKRKEEVMGRILALAPAVVNRITGKNIMPGAVDPMVMMMEGLVSSLSPEQLQVFAQHLTPTQQIQFVELLKAFQAKQAQPNGANGKKEN